MSSAQSTFRRDISVVAAVVLGALVAVLAVLPLALHLRGWLGLPQPNPIPLQYRADHSFTPTYWAPWALSWLVVVMPGIGLTCRPASRRIGLGYTIAAGLCAAGIVAFFIMFEYYGFAAN